jgi:hypothetical protein
MSIGQNPGLHMVTSWSCAVGCLKQTFQKRTQMWFVHLNMMLGLDLDNSLSPRNKLETPKDNIPPCRCLHLSIKAPSLTPILVLFHIQLAILSPPRRISGIYYIRG